MALIDKYNALVVIAKQHNVSVNVKKGVLKITGEVPNRDIKDKMLAIYSQLNPNFKNNDIILGIEVMNPEDAKVKVVAQYNTVSIHKTPGTYNEEVGKVSSGETLSLLNKVNEHWWYIRTLAGIEGFCFAKHLQLI